MYGSIKYYEYRPINFPRTITFLVPNDCDLDAPSTTKLLYHTIVQDKLSIICVMYGSIKYYEYRPINFPRTLTFPVPNDCELDAPYKTIISHHSSRQTKYHMCHVWVNKIL
jgi:hypothetical protein